MARPDDVVQPAVVCEQPLEMADRGQVRPGGPRGRGLHTGEVKLKPARPGTTRFDLDRIDIVRRA